MSNSSMSSPRIVDEDEWLRGTILSSKNLKDSIDRWHRKYSIRMQNNPGFCDPDIYKSLKDDLKALRKDALSLEFQCRMLYGYPDMRTARNMRKVKDSDNVLQMDTESLWHRCETENLPLPDPF